MTVPHYVPHYTWKSRARKIRLKVTNVAGSSISEVSHYGYYGIIIVPRSGLGDFAVGGAGC